AKSEATNTINAYGNLGKKQDYLDQVNSATKTSDITAIVSAAKALNGAITTALGTLADYPNTTTDFATQLKDVSSDAQIQGILDSAKNESNSNLATAKTTATNTINALVNLGTKQSYLNQVDAATKTTDIGTIVSAAQKLNQEITTAIEGLAQYPNLTSDFKSQLQAADSTAKISEILNSAKTENAANLQKAKTEAINTISAYGNLGTKQSYLDQVASATKRSDINSIVSAAQSLNQAITTAIADLAQYPNLTSDFTSQLQAADSTAKISKILNSAKTENTANLQKAKTEAINTISAYGNLGTKQSFIDRVNDATAASAIQGIITEANALNNAISDALTALADYPNTTTDFAGQLKNASSDAQIQGILDSAKNESNSNLATAKTTATNTINALVNLGTKQSYLDKVNAATKVSDIQDIVDAAQGLNQAITTAIADLAQYPNLSTDFKSQLQAADSTAKISEILGSAKNENASNLQTAKNKATATINALSNLGTKQSYLDQVDSATKTSDIDGIVANAQALNTAITTAIGELASYPDVTTNFTGQLKNVKSEAEIQPILEAAKAENTQNLSQSKTTATNTINALENLGTKSDYVNKVAAATTKDQVAGILAEAQALNTAITTAIGGLAQYPDVTTDFATQLKNVKSQADIQPILDAAKKENGTNLQTAKMQAITAIDELQNLGTKSDYVSKVQVAASGAEVQKILADAQSLNTAIGTALTELAQYPNITTDFATQLKNVTSVSELDGILAKAKTENATNLADAKSTAAETINGLSNLGTKQSYLDQVAAATKTSDIDTIVSAASGLNQEITTAIGKLAQYPNTTSDFLTQLKNVKSADELDGILAKAKNENDQNLAEAKSAAADTINGLANLGTKADYLSKVQSANTKDQITALVTQAQALNSAIGTALTELAQYTDVTGNYAEQLKNVTAEDQIKPILDSAKNENDTNVADAKTDAESSINRLQNLEAKQSFLDKVEAAKTVAEAKQAATDAGKLDSAIGTALSTLAQYTDVTGNYAEQLKNVTAESQIQPILDAAKTENEKNLAKAKTDAATSINALKNLEAKQSFLNKVADATTKNQISDIVTEAQTLDSEIGTALSTLAQYPDTTSNFADQLKNVTTQDQIQPILDAAKSENEQNLTTAKTAARKQINELTELGEDSSQYLDEIDRATTRAEIAEVVDKALAKIQTIKDNALGEVAQLINISDTDRATATAAINAAQDVAAIQAALAKAKSADTAGLSATKEAATTAIKANAWITDYTPYTSKLDSVTDKRNFQAVIDEATQANTTAETQAKAAATTEINTLSNLGDDQRKDLVAKANAATTPAELNTVLNNAHVQAQGNLDLAREMAIASVNALANLSDPEKNAYIERINAAPDQSTTISIVNEARAKDNEGLISAKRRAIEVINALQNVLQADKDNYVSTVDAAPDMVKVNAALAAALAADAEGLAYARQRADALISNLQGLDDVTREQLKDKAAKAGNLDEINNQVANAQNQAGAYVEQQRTVYIQQVQALVNLSDAQRSTYISQIQGTNSVTMMSLCALQALSADQTAVNDTRAAAVAKIKTLGNLSVDEAVDFINKVNYTATTSDEVEEFENQAIAQDTANLTNAVSDATSTVKLLKNLSDAEKSSILDNLDKQSTVDGVATSTSQAKLLDAQYLSQARDNALTAIGSLRNLDRSTVDGYLDEIRGVTSVSDAANLVSRATAADNEALNGYKTEQKTVIGALGDLDASEIADYQSQVDNAATRADVIKVVAAAKKANEDAIVAARADATAYLGTLVNLGDAVRQEYINQVGAAKTTQSINAIRADARNKDAQILSTTQTNAISVINGYSKLTSGERDAYKNQIQASRSTDDITRILQQAQADVANRPNSTKDSDISVGGEPAPQKKGLSGLAIAGIVGGVLAIIGLILALLMAR
ncbi:MAG: hypothetical protein Q3962_00975, partial [Corynebacterium sp.]|nr:hypothetical protein [Corynebacterium sp.]